MYQNLCIDEAPSTSAASYNSGGIVCNPASNMITKNGVPCQIMATIWLGSEVEARDNQGTLCEMIPTRFKMSLSTP